MESQSVKLNLGSSTRKEVTVYFKTEDGELVLLTAIVRYGRDCSRAPKES